MDTARSSFLPGLVQDKGKELVDAADLTTKTTDHHTRFNVLATGREYKLAQGYASVRDLEYRSKEKFVDQTFEEYLVQRKEVADTPDRLRFVVHERPLYGKNEAYRNRYSRLHYRKGHMMVMVSSTVYSNVKKKVARYVLDVGREGYYATVHEVIGVGKPQAIRAHIQKQRPAPNGIFMIGAIVAPWYEHGGAQFPCDLFYMDTNGRWTDPDNDGRFEGHDGNVDAEISVGRLYTPTHYGNDAALINDYLDRNHEFRLGQLGHAHSALAYVDDDWQHFDDCAFDEMFPSEEITKYNNPDITDADLYKAEVNSLRSWVQVCAHSTPRSHHFSVSTGGEEIHSRYFRDTNPPNAHFYNLFSCGPGKYTTSDYLGGWYIFDKPGKRKNHGLAAIASAKSGSMLYFEDFYGPMGQGKSIGEAYLDWWKARGPYHSDYERDWFYGLVLLGDPTLSWWTGNVPTPIQPQNGDVFDHFPRRTEFRWDPVDVNGVTYNLEIDAFGAVKAGMWAEQIGRVFLRYFNIRSTSFDREFVGAQHGRWRVRAKIGNRYCSWSPWSYFRYTK